MSNFYVVIPARLNSKRFPNKVIANLFGEIMIQIIYKACERSRAKKVYIKICKGDCRNKRYKTKYK